MRPLLFGLLLSLLGFAGCFETNRSLSSEEQAKVDVAYCGNWAIADPDHSADAQKVNLLIRNIDGKRYFVEWSEKDDKDKTLRMIGWTAKVKDVTFAQLRNMEPDGSIAEKHLVVRIELKDDQLKLRQLDDKFFKDKPLDSDADFKRLIEDNLDNSEMYDDGEVVGTKIK